jgi:hypothetical protein
MTMTTGHKAAPSLPAMRRPVGGTLHGACQQAALQGPARLAPDMEHEGGSDNPKLFKKFEHQLATEP